MTSRASSAALTIALVLATAAPAHARDRSTTGRARLELSFDHGYRLATTGAACDLAADLRVWGPNGVGFILRAGAVTEGLEPQSLTVDVAIGYRIDLASTRHAGLQLAGALGVSVGRGVFDGADEDAYGAFGMIHLDFWHRDAFVGVGFAVNAMLPVGVGQERVGDAVFAITPMVRVGGDLGL